MPRLKQQAPSSFTTEREVWADFRPAHGVTVTEAPMRFRCLSSQLAGVHSRGAAAAQAPASASPQHPHAVAEGALHMQSLPLPWEYSPSAQVWFTSSRAVWACCSPAPTTPRSLGSTMAATPLLVPLRQSHLLHHLQVGLSLFHNLAWISSRTPGLDVTLSKSFS